MSHIDKSRLKKMQDKTKVRIYSGGAVRTVTAKTLKKLLKVKGGPK